jgi:hypothetical protein
MYRRGFVRGEQWMSSGKKKGLCLDVVIDKHDWCCCYAKYPERTHVELRGEAFLRGRNVADNIRGYLIYCLARES